MDRTTSNPNNTAFIPRLLRGGLVGIAVGLLTGGVAFAVFLCVDIPIGTTSPGDWTYAGMFVTSIFGPRFMTLAGLTGLAAGVCGGLLRHRLLAAGVGLGIASAVYFGVHLFLTAHLASNPYERGSLLRMATAGVATGPMSGLFGAVVARRRG